MTVVCFFFLIFADKEEKICQEKRRTGWVIQLLLSLSLLLSMVFSLVRLIHI